MEVLNQYTSALDTNFNIPSPLIFIAATHFSRTPLLWEVIVFSSCFQIYSRLKISTESLKAKTMGLNNFTIYLIIKFMP
jgi:hypothetical protein